MSIASASRVRNDMCYMQICIDAFENGEISGRIYNSYYRDELLFDNCMELIKKLEGIFDGFGYPHATMDLRRFETEEEEEMTYNERKQAKHERSGITQAPTENAVQHNGRGKLATLKTRIMFRQNASWQGNVKWLEEDLEENFSSVLELMLLVNSMFDEE